jgi:hypothetical protein
MRCPKTPFKFGCICVEPHDISKPNLLRIFDIQLGAQGMEGIGEL